MRENGAAWIELRARRGGALPLPLQLLRQLDEVLGRVEHLVQETELSFVVLTTGSPYPDLIGYDLEELRSMQEEDVIAWSHEAQRVLWRLEQLPIPSIAAIRGKWLGAATELALACTYRVATNAETSRMGLPQVRLGFLPAWGGTARLPRLVGLQAALRTILSGESLTLERAMQLGMLDRVLAEDEFMERVERYLARRLERGGTPSARRRALRQRVLVESGAGRRLLTSRLAQRQLRRSGAGRSGQIALRLLTEASTLPFERALALESRAAGELIGTPEMQARLHSQRLTDRARSRPRLEPPEPGSAAVLGAGQTGSEIAAQLASAGLQVRIKDRSRALARQGIARVEERLAWEEAQRRITAAEVQRRTERIQAAAGFGGFGTLQLVVAAADGTESEPEELLRQVEAHVVPSCTLALHAWSASMVRIQSALRHPERAIRLAPALPPGDFPLLEIVPGEATSFETIAAAKALAQRMDLTGILVADRPVTPATRLLAAYFAEALHLLGEGADLEQIDRVATGFGFSAGPFQRLDALGTRRAERLLHAAAAERGEWLTSSVLLESIAAASETFFRYRNDRPAGRNPRLPASREYADERILQRLLLILLNEAIWILEDAGIGDPEELDLIAILGLGFPRDRGGLLYLAESRGIPELLRDLERAEQEQGPRFTPPPLLHELALSGGRFFATPPRRPIPGPGAGQKPETELE